MSGNGVGNGAPPRRARPTIEDVAAEAGVSRGTVSRVLNGGVNVSPAALAAVNKAIKQTGYVVNHHARSLVTQRSRSVAFILSEPQEKFFEDPNFPILLRGCTQALAEHDMPLLLSIAGTEEDRERVVRFIAAGHIDGALLVSTHAGNPVVDRLTGLGVPAVACGLPIGHEYDLAYVAVNEAEGARQATAHLAKLGRRRIATVTGPMDTPGGRDRLKGYQDALRTAGLPADDSLVAHGDYTRASGELAMIKLLQANPDLDAVFVASDLMAVGAIDALTGAGKRVPEDVAVVGFDDSPAALTARPQLTTVRQPFRRISQEMVRLLLARLDGQEPAAVILPTELVIRASA
ncbi:MAG TPA: LacI family DNA-binding transcriptional regulator [Actinocrinis sp.]|uniref:LacI family DNA-binding transcriptional regulator n=1 Tax=Actinocrinis sp. TaxID=1920516 RepID=UPI002D410D83|nr:LacI family DNA-binding transcriptional regulator [Actinocrinis sp.]HZU56104.1 LacI family DNA-binding transcriptional regulator [Actinocrinis sp.]